MEEFVEHTIKSSSDDEGNAGNFDRSIVVRKWHSNGYITLLVAEAGTSHRGIDLIAANISMAAAAELSSALDVIVSDAEGEQFEPVSNVFFDDNGRPFFDRVSMEFAVVGDKTGTVWAKFAFEEGAVQFARLRRATGRPCRIVDLETGKLVDF